MPGFSIQTKQGAWAWSYLTAAVHPKHKFAAAKSVDFHSGSEDEAEAAAARDAKVWRPLDPPAGGQRLPLPLLLPRVPRLPRRGALVVSAGLLRLLALPSLRQRLGRRLLELCENSKYSPLIRVIWLQENKGHHKRIT